MFEITGKYTTACIMIDDVEESCISQIVQVTNHLAFTNPIAIMPDTHAGKGCVIGFTMELGDKLIPNIIGVDLGCGMLSFKIGNKLFDNITKKELDIEIRKRVPFGASVREKTFKGAEFDWKKINEEIRLFTLKFNKRFDLVMTPTVMDSEKFISMCTRIGANPTRIIRSLGTLGGGNHFIEIGKDENGDYWVTIHTGSRNFGKCVAEYWQKLAVKRMNEPIMPKPLYIQQVRELYPKKKWQEEIDKFDKYMGGKSHVPKGTEYLEGEDMYGYLVDMMIAQKYAELNRFVISAEILTFIETVNPIVCIETVHNFIDFEDWIIRKGAIRSYKDELMIIPFNPKDGLLIVEGKSNPEWNCSAPHGAGRLFSRSEAKRTISVKDADKAMEGVYASVKPLDESPLAYKDAEIIEICIEPTAHIVHRVKPVMNMKAKG